MKHWHKCVRWWKQDLPCPFAAMRDHSEECEESSEGERIADEHKPKHPTAEVRPFVEAIVRQGAAPLSVWQAINVLAIQRGWKAITNADAFSTKRHNLKPSSSSVRAQYLETRLSQAYGKGPTRPLIPGKYPRAAPGTRGASGAAVGPQGRGGGRKGGAINYNQKIKDLIGATYKRKLRWSDIARYSSQDASFPHAL